MLTPDDRNAIDGLFARIDDVSRQYPDRDSEAERLIAQHISRSPAAPYYMAQTLVMQEQALAEAQSRIAELEREAAQRPQGGGIFGGLFGGGQPAAASRQAQPARQANPPMQAGGAGGGFLAGAAQTALGVTGGMLLGSAIAGMFSPGQAMAEEPAAEAPTDDEPPADDFGDFGGDDELGF